MSTRPVRRIPNQIELLERILQRTTLTTQQATHVAINDLGGNIYITTQEAARHEKQKAVENAIAETKEKVEKEYKDISQLAKEEAEKNLKDTLENERKAAEEKAQRVACSRDILEAENLKKLTQRLTKKKEDALKNQWEECEKIRLNSVADAIAETTRHLHNQFALEKELAVADALRIAREKFAIRQGKAITLTKEECERKAAAEAQRVARLHQQEYDRLDELILDLRRTVRIEVEARHLVQSEFRALQRDYKRFLDFTDGKYHSDYLLKLRKHGMKFDKNWDRKDSEEISMFPIPSTLAHCRRQNGMEYKEKPKTYNFAPIGKSSK